MRFNYRLNIKNYQSIIELGCARIQIYFFCAASDEGRGELEHLKIAGRKRVVPPFQDNNISLKHARFTPYHQVWMMR